jgi:hypothetical protein
MMTVTEETNGVRSSNEDTSRQPVNLVALRLLPRPQRRNRPHFLLTKVLLNRLYVENIREPESAFTKLIKAELSGTLTRLAGDSAPPPPPPPPLARTGQP